MLFIIIVCAIAFIALIYCVAKKNFGCAISIVCLALILIVFYKIPTGEGNPISRCALQDLRCEYVDLSRGSSENLYLATTCYNQLEDVFTEEPLRVLYCKDYYTVDEARHIANSRN